MVCDTAAIVLTLPRYGGAEGPECVGLKGLGRREF